MVGCLKAFERNIVGPDVAKVLLFLVGDWGISRGIGILETGVEDCGLSRREFVNVNAVSKEYCSGVSSHTISSMSSSDVTRGSDAESCAPSLLVERLLEEKASMSLSRNAGSTSS